MGGFRHKLCPFQHFRDNIHAHNFQILRHEGQIQPVPTPTKRPLAGTETGDGKGTAAGPIQSDHRPIT